MSQGSKLAYPITFGVSLLVLGIGYTNRKKLFPEVFEKHQEDAILSHQQANEFKGRVAEGVKREKERLKTLND
jgi:altronate dehydratase